MSGHPIDQQIGVRLRSLRETLGLSRAAVAAAAGVSAGEIERCEAGAISAPVSMVVRLARSLNASAAELIDEEPANRRGTLRDLAPAGADGSAELVSAFSSIRDGRLRRAFLDLAWTIVAAEAKNEPDI